MENSKQRKSKRRHTRADVQRIHTQTEINRRLYRSRNLAFFLRFELYDMPYDRMPLWLPSVLDFIADDIADVQELYNNSDKPVEPTKSAKPAKPAKARTA
ncbi:TPA: hypothetical protein G5V04_003878 [Salmonella enterica]|nr:hypothetical protein [Salmonella enterica]